MSEAGARAIEGAQGGGAPRPVWLIARAVWLEAIRRKDNVTERERMYIEVWEEAMNPVSGRMDFETLAEELEKIVIAYPDDNEAKARRRCGLGFELAVLLAGVSWVARRTARRQGG